MNQENEVLERDDCGACRGTGVCDMCDGSGRYVVLFFVHSFFDVSKWNYKYDICLAGSFYY